MDQQTPLFSWLHISDLHFGHGNAGTYADQRLVLDALRQDAANIAGQRGIPVPDALLVTGDIAFSGGVRSPTEYRDASEYLRMLRDSLRISRERAFVVPGNHDVQRTVDSERLVRLLIASLREGKDVVDEVLLLEDERRLLMRRQQNYQQFAKDFAPYCLSDGEVSHRLDAWMCQIPARGLTVRFVGFNTALLAAADDDRGKLGIGLGALSQAFLHPAIGPNEVVVALGHHPLRDGWLRNESEIAGWLRKHAQVYLSGHIPMHDTEQSRQGGGNSFVWLSAGAGHADGHDPVHGYNLSGLYVTETGRVVLRVWPRCWDRRGRRFVTDTANTPDGKEYAEHELSKTIPQLASRGIGSSTRQANPVSAQSSANASSSDRMAMPAGKLPTRPSVRQLIYKVLPTDTDFVAFCIDFFPDLARRYSNGMDLTSKINLLFQVADLGDVLARLKQYDPERFRRHQNLLEYLES